VTSREFSAGGARFFRRAAAVASVTLAASRKGIADGDQASSDAAPAARGSAIKEMKMTKTMNREEEIRHSMAVGAKAFAVGAVLILVISVTHAPDYVVGDPVAGVTTSAAAYDDSGAAPAGGAAKEGAANADDGYPPVVVPVPF
jgi:hypothetical protein